MWSWHLDTLDWKSPGVHRIVNTVLKGVKAGNIVLFHDGGETEHKRLRQWNKSYQSLKNRATSL